MTWYEVARDAGAFGSAALWIWILTGIAWETHRKRRRSKERARQRGYENGED